MGTTTEKLDLEVPTLTINGQVTESTTGQPVAGARVQAFLVENNRGLMVNISGSEDGAAMWSTGPMGTDTTDLDGNFQLLVGQEGRWNVNATKEGYSQDQEADTIVEVKAPVQGFRVQMKGSSGVTIRVVDVETQGPIPGAMGEIRAGNSSRSSNLDASGSLEFTDLSPGEVTVTGNARSFAPAWKTLRLEPGEHEEVVLALNRGGSLRIHLPPGLEAVPDTLHQAKLRIEAEDGNDLTYELIGFGDTGTLAPEGEPGQAMLHHAPEGILTVRIGGEGTSIPERVTTVTIPLGGEGVIDLR